MEKIVISGAGLVGAFLAVALKKEGHDVEIFEKRSDMRKGPADGGRSINLIATSRALNAFTSAGVLEPVKKITVPVTGRMMHSLEGELTYQPYGRDESECNYSVSRSLLNMAMMDEAEKVGVKINFEHSLESLNIEESKAVFSGKEVSFDRFFGADGAGSLTRKALLEINSEASETVDFIDSDYKELFMPAGKNGEYPIEKKALHIWPRGDHMLMALPNLDGSFTMTVYLPKTGVNGFDKLSKPEDVETFFEKQYPDSREYMPDYASEFFENPQGRLGTVRMSNWVYKDKVALVGDAAHAIVPFFGQGMNCGMEDCFYLMSFLKKHSWNWEKAFKEYDERQRPNGNAIADMALENFIEMKDKVGDASFLLKKKIEHKIETSFPDLYRSRYGMVTYTLIPYSLAFKAGLIQNEILDELASSIESVEQLDLDRALELVNEKFTPFIKENGISLKRYIEGQAPEYLN
jgi:kynurenine 3-monooxygenase